MQLDYGMGDALQRHPGGAAAAGAHRRGAARRRRARGSRQYHPAGDPQPPRGDRGDQAGRRLQRIRAPAVPLHRAALRSRGSGCWPAAILEAAVLVLDPSRWRHLAQLYGSRYALQGPSGQVLGVLLRRRHGAGMAGSLDLGRTGTCAASSRALDYGAGSGLLPGPACLEQKAWFLLEAPPPAAAGHLRVPASRDLT